MREEQKENNSNVSGLALERTVSLQLIWAVRWEMQAWGHGSEDQELGLGS